MSDGHFSSSELSSDADLMLTICYGSPSERNSAFDILVTRYHARLVGLIRHFGVTDQHDAEDCAQEVWWRVLVRSWTYGERGTFEAWLGRIAYNCVVRHFRRKNAQKRKPDGPPPASLSGFEGEIVDTRLPCSQTEDAANDDIERLRELRHALTPEAREVLNLRYGAGLSYSEIGDCMVPKKSEDQVCRIHWKAIEQLRRGLDGGIERG